jgi:hypothetical protein
LFSLLESWVLDPSNSFFLEMAKEVFHGGIITVMFSCSGVNVDRFLEYVRANPATFADWTGTWGIQTSGVEDD